MKYFLGDIMNWKNIIKANMGRQGPMQEDDYRLLPDKEAYEEMERRKKPFELKAAEAAQQLAGIIANMGDITVTGEKNQELLRLVYFQLANLTKATSNIYNEMYRDVDSFKSPLHARLGDGDGPRRMRNLRDSLMDSSKKLSEKHKKLFEGR